MQNLRQIIQNMASGVAMGHFNFSTLDGLWAIFYAARELNVPVLVGVSEGERDFVGVRQAALLVKSIREQFDYPIFLNADHTHSLEKIKEAVGVGYDAVLFDGSKLSLEDNILKTKEVVEWVRSKNPDCVVEGEMGYIGTSSEILEEVPEGVAFKDEDLTKPEDAARFVKETGVDLFAPAVGNIHGMISSGEPALNILRISEIKKAVGVPLVLHGASGNSDSDLRAAINARISMVHINTEIRLAWRRGLEKFLEKDKREVAPYKILEGTREGVRKVVMEKLKLFSRA